MNKCLLFSLVCVSVFAVSQPTIDGTTNDGSYSTTMAYTSGQNGYGSTNNIGYVKYYSDGTDIYIAVESVLETNGNRIILFLDFSGYSGRAANNSLGTFSGGTGVLPGSSNTNIRLGMEVDFAFEFNIGGGGGCYFDANRLGTGGLFNAGTYVGSSDLSGTSSTPTGLNTNVFSTSNPNVTFAYNNGGGSNQGLELKIPIASLPGIDNTQTIKLVAIIANGSNPTHFSNESIPGDPGSSNPGTNPDLSALSGSSSLSLPVELVSFTAAQKNRSVELKWTTAVELNNFGFEVERKSEKGWSKVGFVEGNGTVNTTSKYSYTDNNAVPGNNLYRLKQIDRGGGFDFSNVVEVNVVLSVEEYGLSQNYPNPFNPATSFTFAMKERQHVVVKVFNLVGQEVATLFNGIAEPHVLQSMQFNGQNLSSGVYFYSLQSKERHEIKKMTLMK